MGVRLGLWGALDVAGPVEGGVVAAGVGDLQRSHLRIEVDLVEGLLQPGGDGVWVEQLPGVVISREGNGEDCVCGLGNFNAD